MELWHFYQFLYQAKNTINSSTVNLHHTHTRIIPHEHENNDYNTEPRLQRRRVCKCAEAPAVINWLFPTLPLESLPFPTGGSLEASWTTWLLDRLASRSHYNKYIMSILYILRRQNLKNTVNGTLGHWACNFANFLSVQGMRRIRKRQANCCLCITEIDLIFISCLKHRIK